MICGRQSMQFTVNRNLFLENLNNAIRAVSANAQIPSLRALKIELSDDELTLTGSNQELTIEVKVPVSEDLTIVSPGRILVPARIFSEIVKKLPGKEFSFEVQESLQVLITSENSEFKINGLDANSYIRLSEVASESSFTISGKALHEVINETVFAVSDQETRPALTGVQFTFADGKIKAVATDSHRLSQRILTLENGPQTRMQLIIAGKSLIELSRIIGDSDPEIVVYPGESQVLFVIGNVSFYSQLLEGGYPETDRLLPTESTTEVEFERSVLSSALDRVSLMTHTSRASVVKMAIMPDQQVVELTGESAESGTVEETVSGVKISGAELSISFNPDYLQAALRASITETIVMKFTEPLRPFTVIPGKDDVDFVQLITPVRTY